MSRINELKKQYPHFDCSIFDFFKKIDPTDSYKYFPLLCKLFKDEINNELISPLKMEDIKNYMEYLGINIKKLSDIELVIFNSMFYYVDGDNVKLIIEFIDSMEKNLIEKKDITSYNNLNEIRSAISLSQIKRASKELKSSVHVEFENDTWLAIRPLSFSASAKYGAGTRWCTTSANNKKTFIRYWENSAFIYFINKKTGYKFAGHKDIKDNNQISFWDASDNMVDSMFLDIDFSMIKIIKDIFETNKRNIDFCSKELQIKVREECYEKDKIRIEDIYILEEEEIIPAEGPNLIQRQILGTVTNNTYNPNLTIVYKNEVIGSDEET